MNFDDCGSCREPVQANEERYSGGFYWEYNDNGRKVKVSDVHNFFQDCKFDAQLEANKTGRKIDIDGVFHNGESELIVTVEPGVME